ncbi:ferrous iron transport protein A [Candidatus Fermentibacteria bacterium]|nr:MAG: ferrous iron transport protein A [Candidatus Fermentibacteria bacterium]PIE51904.1 MAG: ferrous iron transport protein A [Candidatus Fermentibacteria bacterium]PIE53466.1 MAG: ferrous iron transport protein A [Candidatus Fermentibacteria bacterium]
MKLSEMSAGDSGTVTGIAKCEREYRQKLLRMGLVRGVNFTMVRKAPLGDPVEIETDSQKISLRAKEAEVLLVEKN